MKFSELEYGDVFRLSGEARDDHSHKLSLYDIYMKTGYKHLRSMVDGSSANYLNGIEDVEVLLYEVSRHSFDGTETTLSYKKLPKHRIALQSDLIKTDQVNKDGDMFDKDAVVTVPTDVAVFNTPGALYVDGSCKSPVQTYEESLKVMEQLYPSNNTNQEKQMNFCELTIGDYFKTWNGQNVYLMCQEQRAVTIKKVAVDSNSIISYNVGDDPRFSYNQDVILMDVTIEAAETKTTQLTFKDLKVGDRFLFVAFLGGDMKMKTDAGYVYVGGSLMGQVGRPDLYPLNSVGRALSEEAVLLEDDK